MNIIAVDDERLALQSLLDAIKKADSASSIAGFLYAEDALEFAEANLVDVAFLDVEMADISGVELARRLKRINPDINIIFATGFGEYRDSAFELHASGYLTKPITEEKVKKELAELRRPVHQDESRVRIQTFGIFQVFVDEKPLVFRRKKTKELLAFLVDRHGAFVTTEQIALTLWENEGYDTKLKNKVTATVSQLRALLREAGAEEILIKSRNNLALDASKVKCDAYDLEKMKPMAVNAYLGEYMSEYSWAEFTAGRFERMVRENRE